MSRQPSSHDVFPIPLVPMRKPVPGPRPGSRRVDQRCRAAYQAATGTNCILKSLNHLYNSQADIRSSSSSSSSPSPSPTSTPAQDRLRSFITDSVDEFYSSCRRAPADCGSDKERASFLQKSWNIYHHFVEHFASDSIQLNRLDSVLRGLASSLPDPEREWTVQSNVDPMATLDILPHFDINYSSAQLDSRFSYFGHGKAPRAVVPLVAPRVSLPSRLNHVPMLDVLPEADRAFYSSPSLCLRGDFDPSEVSSLAPPTFGGPRSEYVPLLKRLLQLNMVAFTTDPKAVNGLFGVEKDAIDIRLIIHAKPANLHFKPPPAVQLPSPSHLGRLYSARSERLWIAKCDLESYYHQIRVPQWLQPYLALPALTPEEMRELGVSPNAYGAGSVLYPMCTTLPMGWSHAVYIAQSIHEHTLYSYDGPVGPFRYDPQDNLLFLSSPRVAGPGAIHGIVIDDLVIVSDSKDICDQAVRTAQAAYESKDFLVKVQKLISPTEDSVEAFGHEVDGRGKKVRLSIPKCLQLVIRTLKVLCLSEITGLELSSLIGDWLWTLLLHRPALAILQHSYRFIAVANSSKYQLWPSVRRELVLLLLILPLISAKLACPWFPELLATDASNTGGAVVQSALTPDDFQLLWPVTASRHSLYFVMQQLTEKQRSLEAKPLDLSLLEPEFGDLRNVDSGTPLAQPAARFHFDRNYHFIPLLPAARQGVRSASAVGSHFLRWLRSAGTRGWSTVISTPWSFRQHINALELQSVLLAVRHVVSSPLGPGTRILVLSDSAVVTHTLLKGRSSSRNLVAGMRKLAALTLASGCTLQPCWIPTKYNPADEPSRRFQTQTPA